MNATAVPRTVVKAYLTAARLPLEAVARLRGQQHNEQWPPALAFEGLEAGVETVLGSLLRDDVLVEQGRVRQAKVAQLRKAEQLETLADATRAEAREDFATRRDKAEAKQQRAREQARAREQQVAREAQQEKARADERAAKKTAAASAAQASAEQVIERRERAAAADALAKEAQALETRQEALEEADTADVIDASIDATKEARKSN